jgi:hypothetical protein
MKSKLNELRLDAGIARIENQQWLCVLDKETGMMIDPLIGLEKFAELIVKECLRQVEEQYKPVLEDKEMMKDTHWDGYVQCGVDSYVAIREHFFGVEE